MASSSCAALAAMAAMVLSTASAVPAEQAVAPTYITDLSACTPESALSEGPREGCWQVIPYETLGDPMSSRDDDRRHVLRGRPRGHAPAERVRLACRLHRLLEPHHAYDGGTVVKVRLSGDPCFQRVTEPEPGLRPLSIRRKGTGRRTGSGATTSSRRSSSGTPTSPAATSCSASRTAVW